MNISIVALEKLIALHSQKIANTQKQIKDAADGKIKISAMKEGSLETILEESTMLYEKYKKAYDDIPQKEKDQLKENIRIQEALTKQTYYKLQKIRIKKNKNLKRNQKLEAMMIIDELPENIVLEDDYIMELSTLILKENIREVADIEKELREIRKEFQLKIDKLPDNKDLKRLAFLDTYIPIVILHFSLLTKNINETIDEHNENEENEEKLTFRGFPRYEDWWIEELFLNHQAYFGLYKWKDIILNQCITQQQKDIWEKLFSNWLMVKKILNNKEENAYDYNLIFDNLIRKYAQLEEEIDEDNLISMEKIVNNITKKEDFTKNKTFHNVNTLYLKWKKSMIDSKSK